ncbi:MAG: glycosyltransferase [Spirochaetales bacterium]|nr:glycosyltransferase [Spirochaetales bacterium]
MTSIEIFRKELIKLGHNIYVFCPIVKRHTSESRKEEEKNNIFRYFALSYPLYREYKLVIPFPTKLKKIKNLNLDIIHFHTPLFMGLFATYLSRRLKIPLIQTYHTYIAEYVHYIPLPKKILTPLAIRLSKFYCDYSVFVLSPSSIIKDVLLGYGVTSDIIILPTGIEQFNGKIRRNEETRKKYDIPLRKKILICVGRITKEKNFPFLIQAFAHIQKQVPDTILLFIGDGPVRGYLQNQAKKLGIGDKVIFLGYITRNEVMNILAASDIFIFASRTETQGLSLLEAMAAGTPVVAVKAMGVIDIVKNNKGGYLTDPDKHEFTKRVVELLRNAALYDRKSTEAKEVSEMYSSRRLTVQLLDCYQKAITAHKSSV